MNPSFKLKNETKNTGMIIQRLDQADMLGSIGTIPDQVEAAWGEISGSRFSNLGHKVNHIVVVGMGGSALGAHLIQHVFRDELRIPLTVVSDYSAPAWIDEKTLIILSSYSGGTEEVMAIAEYAISKKTPMVVLTTGGDLQAFAEKNSLPAVVFSSELNTCGQPRIGLGYAVTYLLAIFCQLRVLELASTEISRIIMQLRQMNRCYANPEGENPAYQLASITSGKSVMILASEHLTGNAHIMANQWNENAKNLAMWFAIPELNHHLLEGMSHPRSNREHLAAVLIQSDLYDMRNQKRHEITRALLEEQGIRCLIVPARGETALEQAYNLLLLGAYASFYQAIMNDVDPSPIPWVDQFKQLMTK